MPYDIIFYVMSIIAEEKGGDKSGGLLGQVRGLLRKIPSDAYIVAIVLLASSASFGFGFLSGQRAGEKGELRIDQIPLTAAALPAATAATPSVTPPAASLPAGGQYVASRTGTKYYLPWCSTVKNIKEENKVWFASKAAAEAAGYAPASNCPGI
jgi:hypothetical protein